MPDKDYASYGYYEGLDIIDMFDIEVHFEQSDLQMASIERARHDTVKPVYAMEDDGAITVEKNKVTTVGNVY